MSLSLLGLGMLWMNGMASRGAGISRLQPRFGPEVGAEQVWAFNSSRGLTWEKKEMEPEGLEVANGTSSSVEANLLRTKAG